MCFERLFKILKVIVYLSFDYLIGKKRIVLKCLLYFYYKDDCFNIRLYFFICFLLVYVWLLKCVIKMKVEKLGIFFFECSFDG